MRYKVVFVKDLKEIINGQALYHRAIFEMTGVHADALPRVLTEIKEKGYTILKVVIPRVSDEEEPY